MVGANCSIFSCSSSRTKCDVAIFKVPQGDNDRSSYWKKSIITVVTKDSVIDKSWWRELWKNIVVCEIGYPEDQLIRCMYQIISLLFLQKSLKVSCNSGRQACYKLRKKAASTLAFFSRTNSVKTWASPLLQVKHAEAFSGN